MRRKVTISLGETLFRRVKLESVRRGKQISEIVGEALELYLREMGNRHDPVGIVARSWGVLPMDKEEVRRILTEEESFLDA